MAIGRTLERYLLREVGAAFAAAVGLAVSVLFVLRIVEFVDLAFARGVPARLVGALAGYVIPSYLEMAVPMAALLSVVVVFARLGNDGELLAMRASGLGLRQLARPLVTFSAIVAFASFVLGVWARPWANRGIETTTGEMARTRLTASLRPGVFNEWFGGVVLFVEQLEAATGQMRDVMLAEEREEYGRKTIFAVDGRVESNADAQTAYLKLHQGSLLTYHPSGKYHDKTDFDTLELNLDMSGEGGIDLAAQGGPPAMSVSTLLEERARRLAAGESGVEETLELHRKLVLPAAALLLPFIGVPLGSAGRRGVRSRALLVSTLVILSYYLLLSTAVTVAREGVLPPVLAMWAPNILLGIVTVVVFRRAAAEKPLAAWTANLPSFGRHRR